MATTKTAAERAANAHSNLNTFAAVIALLESGMLYPTSTTSADRTAQKIIALCQKEQERQLAIFDREMARIP